MTEPPTTDSQAPVEDASADNPPAGSGEPGIARPAVSVLGLVNRHVTYPNAYTWLLLMSALDIMLTWIILAEGGREVNAIARYVIDEWGLEGMIIYKFALILFFIIICEVVGSLRRTTGRALSRVSIAIGAVPVVWSLYLLARHGGLVG